MRAASVALDDASTLAGVGAGAGATEKKTEPMLNLQNAIKDLEIVIVRFVCAVLGSI